MAQRKLVLYVIACGGCPAAELPALVEHAQGEGWTVCVVTTPSGTKFADAERLSELTGYPARNDYKRPEDPDVLPLPDVFAVVPATFNTTSKWAQKISDTLALGLPNEALGLGLPVVAVPWPNVALARHPSFISSVTLLRELGVTVILDPERLPAPNSGAPGAASFPWDELRKELHDMRLSLDN
ncbi:flavoprotein [Streptosporangium sp. NPDC000396]|uniref:flavoprotein n=1 Tax=Streptosporangium sp. NPDC000396 TaxID=3366185 RepID=UPI0036A0A44A